MTSLRLRYYNVHLTHVVSRAWYHIAMRMFSPIGRNAQQCCDSYGLSLHSIRAVCNKLAWSLFYRNLELPEIDKIQTRLLRNYSVLSMD